MKLAGVCRGGNSWNVWVTTVEVSFAGARNTFLDGEHARRFFVARLGGDASFLVVPVRLARAAALGLSMLYVALIVSFWSGGEGGFDSLSSVASLFETRGLLLAGWMHYLAFDLFVGIWERGESLRIGLSRWLLIPCLFLTFMFGPAGWLTFVGARRFKERSTR